MVKVMLQNQQGADTEYCKLLFHHVVCLCPDRDSGDVLLWFVVVVLTAQFIRNFLQSTGADDRLKEMGSSFL